MPTDFNAFTDQNLNDSHVLLAAISTAGYNIPGYSIAKQDSNGMLSSGIGAYSTNGTLDWNHVSNTRSGQGPTLLLGTAANGPGGATYFHVFNFEYATKNGTGNLTQWAIPYDLTISSECYFRSRYEGTWGSWRQFLTDNGSAFIASSDNSKALGAPSRRFSTVYAATGSINTSDERVKEDIGAIPDDWLDAWGDVEWSRFKFVDGNRWHVGLIAQRVHAAYGARNLDAFEIGLCCYDEWKAEFAQTFESRVVREAVTTPEGRILEPEKVEDFPKEKVETSSAGDRWGLRYDECFAMEAAWQRRELKRAAEARTALEARIAALEGISS